MQRRSRRLVVSFVCTVANYEYGFFYHLYLDGRIEFEVKLTGILSTMATVVGTRSPYGQCRSPNPNPNLSHNLSPNLSRNPNLSPNLSLNPPRVSITASRVRQHDVGWSWLTLAPHAVLHTHHGARQGFDGRCLSQHRGDGGRTYGRGDASGRLTARARVSTRAAQLREQPAQLSVWAMPPRRHDAGTGAGGADPPALLQLPHPYGGGHGGRPAH